MKATVERRVTSYSFEILHEFECKTTKQAKRIAEKLTGEKFVSDGWIGRYSIYASESGLLLIVEIHKQLTIN